MTAGTAPPASGGGGGSEGTASGRAPAGPPAARFATETVAQYYRETRWHYRGLWSGRDSMALHYGYWAPDVRRHAASLYEMNAVLADRAGIDARDRVLDAGCGVGGSSIWLARERGARVHGINIEPGQVYTAGGHAARHGLTDRVDFAVRDFLATGLPDESFDVVWAIESSCYAEDKARFCREAHRLLRPGGRLVVADFFRTSRAGASDRDERRVREWFEQWMITDLDTFDEFTASVVGAGFAPPTTEDATERVRPSARRLFAIGCLTAPLAAVGRRAGLASDLQQANWRSTVRQYTTLRRGLWRYGLVTAVKPGRGAAP